MRVRDFSRPTTLNPDRLFGQVAQKLAVAIISGDIGAGALLPNEDDLRADISVSRTAYREAVKILTAKGLVEARPKSGTRAAPRERWNLLDRDVLAWYATSPDREAFLRTVQEFRHIIEPEASAFAALRRSDEQMEEIGQACRDMASAPTLEARTRADTRFHLAILRAAGNDLLVPLGVLIESAFDHLFKHVTREGDDLDYAQGLHDTIERSIRMKRPEAARRAVRKLLANTDTIIGRPPE